MGNKWELRKSSKPQNQNYKLSIKSNPKQNQPSPQTNHSLQTKTSFIQLHSFFFFFHFFLLFFLTWTVAFESIWKIKQQLGNICIYIKHGQNTSSSMANKNISSNETYPPTLIPKTIPKLQNSLRVGWDHGFSLKACNELQNKERGT